MCGPARACTKTPRCDNNDTQSRRPPHRATSIRSCGVSRGAYRPNRRRCRSPCETAAVIARFVMPACRSSLVVSDRGTSAGIAGTRTDPVLNHGPHQVVSFPERWRAERCGGRADAPKLAGRAPDILRPRKRAEREVWKKRRDDPERGTPPHVRPRPGAERPRQGVGRNAANCSAMTLSTSAGSAVGVPSPAWGP